MLGLATSRAVHAAWLSFLQAISTLGTYQTPLQDPSPNVSKFENPVLKAPGSSSSVCSEEEGVQNQHLTALCKFCTANFSACGAISLMVFRTSVVPV